MAKLLMPLFTTVWEAAALPRIWTAGVIQYFYLQSGGAHSALWAITVASLY
jgi:hypothetical protein